MSSNRRLVHIFSKHQITIPQNFFTELQFEREAECICNGHELILRPIHSQAEKEAAVTLLESLVKQGLTGEALLQAFEDASFEVN